MKILNTARSFFGLLTFLLSVNAASVYCGSVDMWNQKYLQADNDNERLNALMFVHCGPVVNGYDGNIETTATLARLLQNALNRLERAENEMDRDYVHHLVLKNYMRFKLWGKDHRVITVIEKKMAEFFGTTYPELRAHCKSIPNDKDIYLDKGLGQSHDKYARQLKREVSALKL